MTLLPGISDLITRANQRLCEFATKEMPVFITGEPGTEMAFAAKVVHQLSRRASGPLVKVGVSWKLPPDFVDRFRQADGGTILLSTQRNFPVDLQYAILEVVSDKAIAVEGDPDDIVESDIRLIVITANGPSQTPFETRDLLPELADMMNRGQVVIPPLRDRPEDIPALVRYATQRALDTGRSQAKGADAQVLALFRAWKWPGNAEDLLLVTAEAALNCATELITMDDLPAEFLAQLPQEIIDQAREVRLPKASPQPITADERAKHFRMPTMEELRSSRVTKPAETAAVAPPSAEGTDPLVAELDEGHRLQRLFQLARRLNQQSQILARQMKGPLRQQVADAANLIISEPDSPQAVAEALESELDRGLDAILALRRQLAVLNQREQQALAAAQDLYRRLMYSSGGPAAIQHDEELIQETRELAGELQELDTIIRRLSEQFPEFDFSSHELQDENLPGSIQEEEARIIAEAIRRARERDQMQQA